MTEQKRPIALEDVYSINQIEDPRISPDGKWIAFVRVTVDKLENGYKRNIWLSATSGGEPRQLTRGDKDSQPRWSLDSNTLAFVSARSGKPQIYLLPLEAPGGEARALTSLMTGAVGPDWSPDGSKIAFVSPMSAEERAKEASGEEEEPPKDKMEGKHRQERQEEDEKKRLDPFIVNRIPYREGTSFVDKRFAQIFVMDVIEPGTSAEEAPKPRRLTDAEVSFAPPQWSVDGQYLFTSRQRDDSADEPFRDMQLVRIRVEDGEVLPLTSDEHTSLGPHPSPDGKWIAYIRRPRMDGASLTESINRLAIMPVDGGDARDLNLELDRSVEDFAWLPDSSGLVFIAGDYGDAPIYTVDVESGTIETRLHGLFKAEGLHVGPDVGVAYTASTPTSPIELFYLPAETTESEKRTAFNRPWLDKVIVQETHEMRFRNASGDEIQGWYILPVGYEEGKQYPLALNVHGGPHVMWGPSEASMFHEWQLHAASGYVVFYCNPRGGDGYGEGFQRALHSAWGDVAFEDIMAGVDTLLEKGLVDEERMAVTGGSYGGYMTAWIVGHTDRFKAAVSQRGVYNLISFYGTSDVPSLISGEFSVEPWEDHELLWKHSPLAYAHKIRTPLLIIHSENDYRVPIEQAEQLFAFVRRSGGTVEMVRFPRDGHELSRSGEPEHRVERLRHMVEWFDQYCK